MGPAHACVMGLDLPMIQGPGNMRGWRGLDRMTMRLVDPNDPFFDRAITRWLCVLVPAGAGVAEVFAGSWLWAFMFLAPAAHLAWMLFIVRGK